MNVNDTNHVVLVGRLVRDAEIKYTANAKPVSKFTIASNESRKTGDGWERRANYFEVSLWGQLGESLNPYLRKGKQVAISGKLEQERWDQDGYNRSKITVIASTVQLLGGTADNAEGQGPNNNSKGAAPPANEAPPADDGFLDDIPF
jgi:single-strand DNA-binding protein